MTHKHKNYWFYIWIAVLAFAVIACQALSRATPTNTPRPTRTPKPTDILVTEEPITAPTEKPIKEPTIAVAPTQEKSQDQPMNGDVNVLQLKAYNDSGSWVIFGLVENGTSSALTNMDIEVQALNEAGQTVYTTTTYTSLYTLEPGETSPFNAYLYEDVPGVKDFSASVISYDETNYTPPQVDFGSVIVTQDDTGYYHITGDIFNNDSQPIVIYAIAAALYDDAGGLISIDLCYDRLSAIEAGGRGSFRTSASYVPGSDRPAMDSYELFLDTDYYDPQKYDVSFGSITDYVDDYIQSFHLVGEVTNNSDQNLSLKLVGTIFDSQDQVVDVSTTDLVFYNFEPGETLPFSFDYWGPLNHINDPYAQAANYLIQVDWYTSGQSYFDTLSLETSDITVEKDDFNEAVYSGKVLNNSGVDVDSTTVVVAIYDKSNGKILGMEYTFLYESIPNGSSTDFTVYIPIKEDWDVTTLDYKAIAKAVKP
jgi:hypothetical protein